MIRASKIASSSAILLGGLLATTASLNAGIFVGPGATSASFLKVPMAARAAAMGGSFTAVSGDAASIEYNPAGLFALNRTDINATYLSYLESTSLQAVSAGFPVRSASPVLDKDGLPRNSAGLGFHYRLFHTDDTGRNEVGAPTDSFEIRDQVAEGAIAAAPSKKITLGLGLKYLNERLESRSVSNYAADAGAIYAFRDNLSFGLSILNVGPSQAFITEKDPLPATVHAGIAYQKSKMLMTFDSSAGRDKILRQSTGIEYSLNRFVRFRGGLVWNTTLDFSGGLGVQFPGPAKTAGSSEPFHRFSSTPTRAPKRNLQTATSVDSSAMIAEKMNDLAQHLATQYKTLTGNKAAPILALLPLKSENNQAGPMFSELLNEQFSQMKDFTVVDPLSVIRVQDQEKISTPSLDADSATRIGKEVGANVVLLGEAVKIEDDKYMINTRLIDSDSAKTMATAYEDIEWSPTGVKPKLASVPETPPPPEPQRWGNAPPSTPFPNVDIGLDYAIRTEGDLGLTHTVSLRVLY